jgi:hypothetical protein
MRSRFAIESRCHPRPHSTPPVRRLPEICQPNCVCVKTVEQAFKTFKSVDLRVRPIHHRLARRVRAHIFLCLLAYYVEWHLRQAWAPYLFEDEHPGRHEDGSPVRPALRSEEALRKASTQHTPDGETVHSFATLIERLSTVTLDEVAVPAHPEIAPFHLITTPDPLQRELFRRVGLEGVGEQRRQKGPA